MRPVTPGSKASRPSSGYSSSSSGYSEVARRVSCPAQFGPYTYSPKAKCSLQALRNILADLRSGLQVNAGEEELHVQESPTSATPTPRLPTAEAERRDDDEEEGLRAKENRMLTVHELAEIESLLKVPPGSEIDSNRAQRCAALVGRLNFFQRLSRTQAAHLLRFPNLLKFRTGEFVYREGDPLGTIYVVLSGALVVEQKIPELGGIKTFTNTVYHGRACGDRWDHGGEGRSHLLGRWTAAIAQEDSWVLRFKTTDYLEAFTDGGQSIDETVATLRKLPFLQACTDHDVSMLAMMLVPMTAHHGECILEQGRRPAQCYILCSGVCQLQIQAGRGHQRLVLRDLKEGGCFGLGALLQETGVCPYSSRSDIVVESSVANFYLLSSKSLLNLPDAVKDTILAGLQAAWTKDPLLEDGLAVIQREHDWQQERRRVFYEEARCASKTTVLAVASAAIESTGAKPRPTSATLPRKLATPWLPVGDGTSLARASSAGSLRSDIQQEPARKMSRPASAVSLASKGDRSRRKTEYWNSVTGKSNDLALENRPLLKLMLLHTSQPRKSKAKAGLAWRRAGIAGLNM